MEYLFRLTWTKQEREGLGEEKFQGIIKLHPGKKERSRGRISIRMPPLPFFQGWGGRAMKSGGVKNRGRTKKGGGEGGAIPDTRRCRADYRKGSLLFGTKKKKCIIALAVLCRGKEAERR